MGGEGGEKERCSIGPCYANSLERALVSEGQQEDYFGLAGVLARTVWAQRHAIAPCGKEQQDVLGEEKDN